MRDPNELYPSPPWPDGKDPILAAMIDRGLRLAAEGLDTLPVVTYTAAHGWMEGHILAEQGRDPVPEPVFFATEQAPTPPFPASKSEEFTDIVAEEIRRFGPEPDEAELCELLLAATTRAWAAGHAEGRSCLGCMPVDGEEGLALRNLLRKGLIPVLPEGEADVPRFELLSATVATYKDLLAAGRTEPGAELAG